MKQGGLWSLDGVILATTEEFRAVNDFCPGVQDQVLKTEGNLINVIGQQYS